MTADFFLGRYPYVLVAVLMVIGVYGMLMKRNLLKKVIGMTVFQTAIYLLFIQGATKVGATIPVRTAELGSDAAHYINPLPQVVILTAIVVGVAITGVALSLLLVIHRRFGTLDEVEILEQMRESR
jgi:multicomponent Na+:H+ antiporter subunit C